MEGLIFGYLRYVYNPCLEVLTFSNKHNVTGVSVLNLVKMPLPTCSNCHEYARCVDDKCVCLDGYVGNGKVCEGIYESQLLQLNYYADTSKQIFQYHWRTNYVLRYVFDQRMKKKLNNQAKEKLV